MELAAAALGSLLPKLGTLLSDEYKLQKGVRGEIRFLQAEMECMQAALDRVSMERPDEIDALHKIWVRDLKELVYDIEDSVDVFMVRIDAHGFNKPHSFRRFFERTIGLLTKVKHRHHIADDIQEIKSRIQEVACRREKYKFENIVIQPDNRTMDTRLPALYQEVKNLVGIDGPAEKLTVLLMHREGVEKNQLMIVSIYGVGGLGKTTLANSVYQRLRGGFQSQAFVSVSLKPDVKKIFRSILRQVSEKEYINAETWNHTELIDKIRQILDKNRYIIVIDDLWDESAWTQIKCALIENNLGSRVIVTTRNASVAKFSCSRIDDGTMYELDPLSLEDSKRLLCKRVFNEDEGIHSELEEVSRKILKKCGGVPLAIITIASLLASRPNKTKHEWYSVLKSMGSGLEKDRTLEKMRDILYLSYSDLPSYLKPCLLYLSIFPEDHEIRVRTLAALWVVEGLVEEKQGSNVYDLAERYCNDLINRSMIQPVHVNESGEPQSCRVHDMILDLIISLSVQENFVTTVSEGSQLVSPVCNKLRRLSLHGSKVYRKKEECKEELVIAETENMSHVRTLFSFGETSQRIPPLARFSVLRVLSLEHFPTKYMHAKDLGSLHHLRYLKLGGMFETKLPEGIGNLQHLKVLDLWSTYIKELPASIVQLTTLELLFVRPNVKFPDGIGNLVSLQRLGCLDISVSPNIIAELGNLIKLTTLGIYELHANESYVETFLQSLSNLGNLHCIIFQGVERGSLDCMPDEWRGPAQLQHFHANCLTFSKVPRWFSSLSELSILSICIELLRQEDMKLLGSLTVLRFLNLIVDEDGTMDERLVVSTDQPFRSLEEFKFEHYTGCCLLLAKGVMPKLQKLKLYFEVQKREGGGFDTGLDNLASLKHVAVEVNCKSSRITEVEDAETKIRDAIGMNQNHPTLKLSRVCEDEMVIDEEKDDPTASEMQSESKRNESDKNG